MATFSIKRNDQQPFLSVELQDSNGSPVDLTNGSRIFFNMATDDNNFTPILSGNSIITGSAAGTVEYRWAAGDTNRSGTYLGEFEVTWSGTGNEETYPADHTLFIKISEDYDT